MDFVLYPLDVQKCIVDFSSCKPSLLRLSQKSMTKAFLFILDKYTVKELVFHWRKDHPLTFPNDFGENGFRLPKYVVSFHTHKEALPINFDGDGNNITAIFYHC